MVDWRVRFPAAAACTGMVDRLRTGKPPRYFIKPSGPTQSPTLRGTGNEYRPNCGDAVVISFKIVGKRYGVGRGIPLPSDYVESGRGS